MEERNFMQMLRARQDLGCFVCVGLDTDTSNKKFPHAHVVRRSERSKLREFNRVIVGETAEHAACYKINIAFYEALGPDGFLGLMDTIDNIKHDHPEIPIILDAKRGDIGNTNLGYVRAAFEYLEADAITVPPYMGRASLAPFLDLKHKGVFVLVRTSNEGAGEFQDMPVILTLEQLVELFGDDLNITKETADQLGWFSDGRYSPPLYEYVAARIANVWNKEQNCGVVVGATAPEELVKVRQIVGPDMQILIPGVGAQGGDLEASVKAALGENDSRRFIVNLSRSVIFASSDEDFPLAAGAEVERITKIIRDTILARKPETE